MLHLLFATFLSLILAEPKPQMQTAPDANATVLSLTKAVDFALQNNYGLKNAKYDVDISKSNLRIAKDDFSLRLSVDSDHTLDILKNQYVDGDDSRQLQQQLGLNLSREFSATGGTASLYSNLSRTEELNDLATYDFNSVYASESYTHSFGIRYTQPLLKDAWRKVNRVNIVTSQLDLQNTDYALELERRSLIVSVIGAYYRALKAKKLLEVNYSAVEEAETHLNQTRIRLEEGLVAQIDVSQAELQLSRKEDALISAQESVEDALDDLKILMTVDLDLAIDLSAQVEYHPEEIDASSAIREALQNRLELKQYRNYIKAVEQSIIVSNNNRLPDLDLALEAGVVRSDRNIEEVFKTDDPEYIAGLSIYYTFGDKSKRESYLQSLIRKRKLENSLANLELEITRRVRGDVRYYNTLKKNIDVVKRSVELAEYALKLANQSYAEGLIGNIELIEAQDKLLQAQTNYISKLMDFEIAKANILLSLGRVIRSDDLRLTSDSHTD